MVVVVVVMWVVVVVWVVMGMATTLLFGPAAMCGDHHRNLMTVTNRGQRTCALATLRMALWSASLSP